MKPFYVYLLLCRDGTYYAGHTDDLEVRLSQHQAGDTGYTATRKPVQLVWQGEFESREGALAFERQIKGWSRAKKEALIAGDWDRVQALARSGTAQGLRQAQPERRVEYPERRGEQPERRGEQPERGGEQPERGGEQPERSGGDPKQSEAPSERGVQHRESTSSVRPESIDKASPESFDKLRTGPVEGLTQNIVSGAPMAQRRALDENATLVTHNTREFERIQGLKLENWASA